MHIDAQVRFPSKIGHFKMKENLLKPNEWSDNQRRIIIDTAQLYDAHLAAFRENRSYRGGMHCKKLKGREYLFRSKDRYGMPGPQSFCSS